MKTQKFATRIGGVNFTIVEVDLSQETSVISADQNAATHHILITDQSLSMSANIDLLVDQLEEANNHTGPNDRLSIFEYSSPGYHKPVVIMAKPGEDIKSKLQTLRRTIGSTCFSEVMDDVAKLVYKTHGDFSQTVATLFTDGNAVTPWSREEEEQRTLFIVRELSSFIPAFNTIGFGNLYNIDFLKKLSAQTDHGIAIHQSSIKQFLDIFRTSVKAANHFAPARAQVFSPGADIVYVSADTTRHGTYELELNSLNQVSNKFYVMVPPGSSSDPYVRVNDELIHLTDIPDAKETRVKEDAFYALANGLYYKGDRQKAVDIVVNNLKDRKLADMMTNALTPDEVGDTQAALRHAVIGGRIGNEEYSNSNYRYVDGKTPPNYMPAKDALCVMDVLRMLTSLENPAFYVPYSKNAPAYTRIGAKIVDNFNVFTPNDLEKVRASVDEFIWSDDHVNLSLRFIIPGTAKLNPRDVMEVNEGAPEKLPQVVDCVQFRTHTFVKDGNINIKKAEFLIHDDDIDDFLDKFAAMKNNPVEDLADDTYIDDNCYARVVIDFTKMPFINRKYVEEASTSLDKIMEKTRAITYNKSALRLVNHFLKTLRENFTEAKQEAKYTGYTEAQIHVLEKHSISREGVYGGIDNTRDEAADTAGDSYETRVMNFYIKGAAEPPTMGDFFQMVEGKKKPNIPGQMMLVYYDYLKGKINGAGIKVVEANKFEDSAAMRALMVKERKSLTNRLNQLRADIAIVKAVKLITHDWFPGLKDDGKGNFVYETTANTLVMRAKRAVVKL